LDGLTARARELEKRILDHKIAEAAAVLQILAVEPQPDWGGCDDERIVPEDWSRRARFNALNTVGGEE
jgi:hypothetical protein